MLESSILRVRLDADRPDSSRRRESFSVHAPGDGAAIGRLIFDSVTWLPWRVRWQLAAFESPEESELFVGRRAGWAPRDWDVFDADGRLVALVRGAFLLSAAGDVCGQCRRSAPSLPGGVVDSAGARLASWSGANSELDLRFAPEIALSPFLKMAIVVAALLDL